MLKMNAKTERKYSFWIRWNTNVYLEQLQWFFNASSVSFSKQYEPNNAISVQMIHFEQLEDVHFPSQRNVIFFIPHESKCNCISCRAFSCSRIISRSSRKHLFVLGYSVFHLFCNIQYRFVCDNNICGAILQRRRDTRCKMR